MTIHCRLWLKEGLLSPTNWGISFWLILTLWALIKHPPNKGGAYLATRTLQSRCVAPFSPRFLRRKCRNGVMEEKHARLETDADSFAIRLLAPACVLWGLGLHTPDEIAAVCDLPLDIAKVRAKRMKELYERDKFLKKPLERKVFEQFREYIEVGRKN